MNTVFERIPEVFVDHYDSSFEVWAREFRKRGPECAIPFDRRPGETVLLDAGGRPIFKGAWFVAEVDRSDLERPRMVIKPKDGFNEDLIERHVQQMARHWVS